MESLYDTSAFEEEILSAKPSEEDLELFRQQVSEWLKLDDQIRKLSVAVRERKVHQRAIGQKIQNFMLTHNYDNLNTQQGRIRATSRSVKPPVKIADIRQTLLEFADKPITGQELMDRIFNCERPAEVKHSIRRIIPKVSMSLDL
jgi:hypothetical protein